MLNMPREVREAYTQKLVDQLSLPAVKGEKGKLYWEWLTDFQRDWLGKNLPEDMVKDWVRVTPESAAPRESVPGAVEDIELSWAFAMFRQYSERPEGAEPPAAYAQYLLIREDTAARNAFLDAHPEVKNWLSLGPMANMPDHIRRSVTNIMVKYGRWEGEIDDDGGDDVELSWAYEQMRKYSKRPEGATAPAAYQQYLAIPYEDKAARRAFLGANPSVKAWLDSGPMANMPAHVRQEVTNIMVRAGKWEGEVNNEGAGGNPELSWAYEMFKQYSKRSEGAKPPVAYDAYLALPANPAVRNQFLDKHPEVSAWIAQGPMANMPEHIRFMVQNIMIKNGKWDGEIRSDSEVNDLSFAREQLRRWNMRGKTPRPLAYDKWLLMPSGVEKAQFLKANPEIGEWLRLGPMANMPDAYQDVVRDIMVRYGEWTQETDGLGKVISGYYETPGYARDEYLEDHPELVAYWAAIQTPEERKTSAMVDQYFSIKDPTSRQAYLIIHPELKDHFMEQRTRRYEKFLTHVAVYMGGHPEMFERYLERQEDVLNDLLLRYATPPLLKEVAPMRDAQVSSRQRIRG